jgi:hypothetical protein
MLFSECGFSSIVWPAEQSNPQWIQDRIVGCLSEIAPTALFRSVLSAEFWHYTSYLIKIEYENVI